MSMHLTFCGAAGMVTGSCYLVRHAEGAFLVDCGLFQGPKSVEALTRRPFPFMPSDIDFVLLTHAHIDHSGLLPKLVREGFTGPIFATAGARDLLSIMLPDSAHIQEADAERAREGKAGKSLATPIYTSADAEAALRLVEVKDYGEWFAPGRGVRARLWNAGHILGAASIELHVETGERSRPIMRVLFSGDIGPAHKLFHPDPEAPSNLDYVICEATYGARRREILSAQDRRARLADIVNDAFTRDGVLVIPAFAVERTQELLIDLAILMKRGNIRHHLLFLDSPLAIRATEIFAAHAAELEDVDAKDDLFDYPSFHFTLSTDESKKINVHDAGVIIIASSGMCEGGRIRHHLKRRLRDERNTILLTGYQASGTLGAALESGEESVTINGVEIAVRARVLKTDMYSAHVDADGLVEWLEARRPIKGGLFLTHGEDNERAALRARLVDTGFDAERIIMPQLGDEAELMTDGAPVKLVAARRFAPDER
ncbi:MAG: MBL fold metallo-hydrolase [Amphiplicatus sp.]